MQPEFGVVTHVRGITDRACRRLRRDIPGSQGPMARCLPDPKSAEVHLSWCPRGIPHPAHANPATGFSPVLAARPLSGPRPPVGCSVGWGPSLHDLRRKLPSIVRSLPRYYDFIRLLIRVHARRTAFAFPSRPGTTPGTGETSKVPRRADQGRRRGPNSCQYRCPSWQRSRLICRTWRRSV